MSVTSFETLPLRCLRPQTIMAFCELLDIEQPIGNDYNALAEHLKISYTEMGRFKRELQSETRYPSMAMRLFCRWAEKSVETANAKLLIEFLQLIERADILKEIQDYLDEDLVIAKSQSNDNVCANDIENLWKQIELPNTDERLFTSDLFNPIKMYDGIISYNPNSKNDERWTGKIHKFLTCDGISIHGRQVQFRVAVGARDLLPGNDYASALVRAIKHRCKRVILLISETFVKSNECVFQMQIAKSLDLAAIQRKVIPVRLDDTDLPEILFNLNSIHLNVPSNRIDNEMRRLAMSLL